MLNGSSFGEKPIVAFKFNIDMVATSVTSSLIGVVI